MSHRNQPNPAALRAIEREIAHMRAYLDALHDSAQRRDYMVASMIAKHRETERHLAALYDDRCELEQLIEDAQFDARRATYVQHQVTRQLIKAGPQRDMFPELLA